MARPLACIQCALNALGRRYSGHCTKSALHIELGARLLVLIQYIMQYIFLLHGDGMVQWCWTCMRFCISRMLDMWNVLKHAHQLDVGNISSEVDVSYCTRTNQERRACGDASCRLPPRKLPEPIVQSIMRAEVPAGPRSSCFEAPCCHK